MPDKGVSCSLMIASMITIRSSAKIYFYRLARYSRRVMADLPPNEFLALIGAFIFLAGMVGFLLYRRRAFRRLGPS